MQKGYVGTTNPDVNYKELEREQIVILKDLVEELRVENIKKQEALSSSPSGNSTESVDGTDTSTMWNDDEINVGRPIISYTFLKSAKASGLLDNYYYYYYYYYYLSC